MITANETIRREVEKHGVVSFARFMELALYHPGTGYYEREKSPGKRGDFYTSVSVGSLFGELLAFQFAEWLEAEAGNQKPEVRIIEAGAHDGQLAKDILNWLQSHRPKLFSEINYTIIEPSPCRQKWQRETLKDFKNVEWFSNFENLKSKTPNSKLNGIVFSNELLDAFPVRRFGWNAKEKKWFEWGVSFDGDKFVWAKIQNPEFRIQNSELESVLPDNFTLETSPAAESWWRDASKICERGKLLTLDYGLTTEEIFSPARTNGTLRAYFKHRVSDDILANAGEQDITAHINFSAIQKIGEDEGLITEFFDTQSKFLTEILAKAAKSNSFREWNSNQTRQFQTLTHPEHLGRAFRVLVQSR